MNSPSNRCRHNVEYSSICDQCDDEAVRFGPGEPVPSLPSVQALQTRIHALQLSRFPCQTVDGKLNHLCRELEELRKAQSDVSEHADCLILLFGIAALCGFTIDDLLAAARAKMVINENRQWHAADADGVYRHKEP